MVLLTHCMPYCKLFFFAAGSTWLLGALKATYYVLFFKLTVLFWVTTATEFLDLRRPILNIPALL